MGKVIQIADVTRVASTDTVLTFIDECYERLARVPGFVVREEQKKLSREVCRALCADEPLAAEAPTGTGKTMAYLIGAIAASERLRTTKDIPIVVATATVGLQTQILDGDLPRLAEAGIIAKGETMLAKGRSRYFCVQSAERLLQGSDGTPQYDIFDEQANHAVETHDAVQTMLDLWNERIWNGDSDAYPTALPQAWPQIAATSETCTGHKCPHYNACPFFNARRALSSARIIVANHDLVLSDLAMVRDGLEPLFPGSRYLVVFDEAHHLPDKALDVGSAKLEIEPLVQDLPRLVGFTKTWQRNPDLARLFDKQKLKGEDFDPAPVLNGLAALKDELVALPYDPDTSQHRFAGGVVPASVLDAAQLTLAHGERLLLCVQDAIQTLKQTNLPEKNESLKPLVGELLYQTAFFNAKLSGLVKALSLFVDKGRAVRWAFSATESTSLHVSPLEGADVLRELLWNSERACVAMVSATLCDFEGFDRFAARVGAPTNLRTLRLPHIFPYRENTLYLVEMAYSPRWEEKEKFEAELAATMPGFIDPAEGTLVLFPSRSLMRKTLPALRSRFGASVLVQGEQGIKELVTRHRARIDAGKGSVLCGLATLAEGLDLPGKYCTHVVICALPFAVPTTPVEQELQEVLGRDYFAKRALPDTLVRLVQMVGRLMRRESDRGRITVFDKRLLYTQWGRKLLSALPPFRRKRVAPDNPPVGPAAVATQGQPAST